LVTSEANDEAVFGARATSSAMSIVPQFVCSATV
jgi:hypothetical protein